MVAWECPTNPREASGLDPEAVHCSSAKSEPSKTYAMPESRLLRIETEAADGGRAVYERVAREALEAVFDSMYRNESLTDGDVAAVAQHVGGLDPDLVDEARELAEVKQTIGGDGPVDPSAGGSFET